jgi:glutamine synthetase
VVEAERRGLPHARNTPNALRALHTEAARALFASHDVFSADELHARYDVRLEQYNKKVEIEADVLRTLVDTQVLPAALTDLAHAARQELDVRALGSVSEAAVDRRMRLSGAVDALHEAGLELNRALAATPDDEADKAAHNVATVVPAMASVRSACDALEEIVADGLWPLPRYREMLFLY